MGFWSKLFGCSAAQTSCCGGGGCCGKSETKTSTKSETEHHECCGKGTCSLWKEASILDEDKAVLKTLDSKIVVGNVLSVEAHPDPNMTKVRVAQVSFGGEPVQILCGGVNLESGQIVPVARVGAKLSEDFEIGVRDIRGVPSNGMICARAELGLSPADEKKGEIWVLPTSFKDFLGQSLAQI